MARIKDPKVNSLVVICFVIVGLLMTGTAISLVWFNSHHHDNLVKTRPSKDEYKYIENYSDGAFLYTCSRPIKAHLQTVPSLAPNGDAKEYVPLDSEEAKLFCYSNAVIENKGKIKVLQRPDVEQFIAPYKYSDVSIKALDFHYIEDPDFVDRLLPNYQHRDIGCIIIVETPVGKLVFLEDENLEVFEAIDSATFDSYLASASQDDRQTFMQSIR